MAVPNPFSWGSDGDYPGGPDPWAGTPINVEPAAGQKAAGFEPGSQLAAQHFNWLAEQVGLLTQNETPALLTTRDISRSAAGSGLNVGVVDVTAPGSRIAICVIAAAVALTTTDPPLANGIPMIQCGLKTNLSCYYLFDSMIPMHQPTQFNIVTPDLAGEYLTATVIFGGVAHNHAPIFIEDDTIAGTEITTLKPNVLLVDFLLNMVHTEDPTVGSDQTELVDGNGSGTDIRVSASYRVATDPGDYTMHWTGVTGASVDHITLAIRPLRPIIDSESIL